MFQNKTFKSNIKETLSCCQPIFKLKILKIKGLMMAYVKLKLAA